MAGSKKKASRKSSQESSSKAATPSRRSCACGQAHMGLLDRYPEFRANLSQLEHFTRGYVQSGAAHRVAVTKIPVVVHVVHKRATEKISVAQVKSQITAMNKDFRATNPDKSKIPDSFKPLSADTFIEFFLAMNDPDHNATNGITYTKTDVDFFSHAGDPVKFSGSGGIEPWDTKRYLNMWVCSLKGGLLGYAQFPGGPSDTDGVVIRNTAFGTTGTAAAPFDKGRTATHEVGHYLNLSHIWGEDRIPTCTDSDFVDDTPNQFRPNTGTPAFPHISCNNAPDGDMFMNYMDYVDDVAMFMFTHGQVARMRAALEHDRSQLGI